MKPQLIRYGEGKFIMEGDECTQIYTHTDKLVFSVSTPLPGQKACLDNGHDDAHETVYVIQGFLMNTFALKKATASSYHPGHLIIPSTWEKNPLWSPGLVPGICRSHRG